MSLRRKSRPIYKRRGVSCADGFSLVEFLIATAIFMVLSGAILDMFSKQAPYFTR